jgi:radical SAM superfamily enzyme YgiQ (UPF0313 family)
LIEVRVMAKLDKLKKALIVVPPLVDYDSTEADANGKPDFENERLCSPIDPATVAADLRRLNIDVRIVDLGISKYRDERTQMACTAIDDFHPDVIAVIPSIHTFISSEEWLGEAIFEHFRATNPNGIGILAGAHATNFPGHAVQQGVCDYSIRGEADLAVGLICAALNGAGTLSDIRGLSYRDSEGEVHTSEVYPDVAPEDLPIPDYSVLDATHRKAYSTVLERGKIRYPEKSAHYRDIMTSRSCVLRCSYCAVSHLRGGRQSYRRKPLDNVIAEIEQALEQGIEEIHFFDDLFVSTTEQAEAFVNELQRRNLKFPWFVAQGMPLWPLNRDVLQGMAETGMYRLIAPFESGSSRVLREVAGKIHSSAEHHGQVSVWAHEVGLEIVGMFVIGMPKETRSEILETLTFAEDHPEIDYCVFSIATPIIGTRLTKTVLKDGHSLDPDVMRKVVKRTVALYKTDSFEPYEMGVFRAYDWDRINFLTLEKRQKYARMVGITLDELDMMRAHSKEVFNTFFPDFDGPYSFRDLFDHPGLYGEMQPKFA